MCFRDSRYSQLEPRAKLLPGAFVHADLTASSALAVADEQRAAAVIEIGFGEAEGFLRSPARQRITIRPRGRRAWAPSPALRMTATISSTFGGSGVVQALVASRAAGVEPRHGRRRATSASAIEQQLRQDPPRARRTNPRIG
jgi:hypothetical protein